MSDKMTCPGCGSHTSSVWHAYIDGESMPCCGLSNGAIAELITIRDSRANDSIKAIADAAVKRANAAETELGKLRRQVQAVRDALEEAS